MLAGRPHEAVGNGSPRWMTVGPRKRAHRTRPTGRLTPFHPPDLRRCAVGPTPVHIGCTSAVPVAEGGCPGSRERAVERRTGPGARELCRRSASIMIRLVPVAFLKRRQRSAVLELVHVGRSIPLGALKSVIGFAVFAFALGGELVIGFSNFAAAMAGLVPALWLADWGTMMLVDGVSDVYVRLARGDVQPALAMVLSADGVRLSRRYTGVPDASDLTVPWGGVTGAAFRRGPQGFLWFCLDAPGLIPGPEGLDRDYLATMRVESIPLLAAVWINSVIRPDDPREYRRILGNVFWFGTPLAVNLAVCPGVTVRRVDRFLVRHAPEGIRCISPQREWWQPPPLSRYLAPIGFIGRDDPNDG
jgi:hypothetical protein